MADDDKTQPGDTPTEATPAATEPTPATAGKTEAATQAGAPAAPKPPKPPKQGGGGVTLPTPLVVIGAIVLVAAIVFAIINFTGKSSAEDDKKKAEDKVSSLEKKNQEQADEIAADNEEIDELNARVDDLSQQLGQSEDFAAALDEVLSTGVTASDSLYDCAVTAYDFALNFLNTGVPDQGQAQAVDDRCVSAEDNYNAFNTALNDLANA